MSTLRQENGFCQEKYEKIETKMKKMEMAYEIGGIQKKPPPPH